MISKLGDRNDLVKNMIGSQAGAQRLRNVMQEKSLVFNLVLSMVAATNKKLTEDTVKRVVTDFLDVLFDLSKPYRVEIDEEQ